MPIEAVKDVMTPNPERIGRDDTLQDAARRMRTLNIGFLVVCDVSGVVGVITDRDLSVRATADGRDPTTTPVSEAMTAQVVSCREDDRLANAVHLMQRTGVRRLVVVDHAQRLAGVLSVDDVAHALGRETITAEILRHTFEPI